MSLIPVRLWDPTFVSSPVATIFTALGPIVITRAVFVNINVGASETLTVYLNTADNQHTIIQSQSLAPGQPYFAPEMAGLVLNTGDIIRAAAGVANQITCYASGYQR